MQGPGFSADGMNMLWLCRADATQPYLHANLKCPQAHQSSLEHILPSMHGFHQLSVGCCWQVEVAAVVVAEGRC